MRNVSLTEMILAALAATDSDQVDVIGAYDDDYELDMLAGDEIVGVEEIVGNETLIGAVADAVVAKLQRARKIDPRAALVKRKRTDERRRKLLPTNGVSVLAGAQTTIVYATEELFRAERYVIDEETGADFVIEDILVGTRSMFASTGEVHASIFRPDAVDCNIEFDTANVGNKVKVIVRNLDGAAPHTFYGTFIGTVAQ